MILNLLHKLIYTKQQRARMELQRIVDRNRESFEIRTYRIRRAAAKRGWAGRRARA